MKRILLPTVLLLSIMSYAQTGINTNAPSATLDIISKGAGNTVTTNALEINDTNNKELMNVGDSGSIRFTTYKNASMLSTDANGNLKIGTAADLNTLNIPVLTTWGTRSATTGFEKAGTSYHVEFITTMKNNISHITYNASNATFTVVKAGYYNIQGCTYYDLEPYVDANPITKAGSVITRIKKIKGAIESDVSRVLTSPNSTALHNAHSIAGTAYFDVGDSFYLEARYTGVFRVSQASISAIYYKQ